MHSYSRTPCFHNKCRNFGAQDLCSTASYPRDWRHLYLQKWRSNDASSFKRTDLRRMYVQRSCIFYVPNDVPGSNSVQYSKGNVSSNHHRSRENNLTLLDILKIIGISHCAWFIKHHQKVQYVLKQLINRTLDHLLYIIRIQ